jgi:hypoxanthine phosphoribosyltransferase
LEKAINLEQQQLHDKSFELYISSTQMEFEVDRIANQMNHDLEGKSPIFLSLLNGSFMFTADLLRRFKHNCQVSFVKLASYDGTQSSGNVNKLIGLNENLEGRTVVIIEDIVDSGTTLHHFLKELNSFKPAEVKIASMFFKPECCKFPIKIDYLGMEIPDYFIVGYGLDYNGLGRNYKDLYKLKEE